MQNSADTRSAFAVSRSVSWNSGAKVATTSIPYADQHMKYSHVRASASPPPSLIPQVKFALFQSPVRYGKTISTKHGMHSRAPVT